MILIHIERDHIKYGPYTLQEISQHISDGYILANERACIQGTNKWIEIRDILKENRLTDNLEMVAPSLNENNEVKLFARTKCVPSCESKRQKWWQAKFFYLAMAIFVLIACFLTINDFGIRNKNTKQNIPVASKSSSASVSCKKGWEWEDLKSKTKQEPETPLLLVYVDYVISQCHPNQQQQADYFNVVVGKLGVEDIDGLIVRLMSSRNELNDKRLPFAQEIKKLAQENKNRASAGRSSEMVAAADEILSRANDLVELASANGI